MLKLDLIFKARKLQRDEFSEYDDSDQRGSNGGGGSFPSSGGGSSIDHYNDEIFNYRLG